MATILARLAVLGRSADLPRYSSTQLCRVPASETCLQSSRLPMVISGGRREGGTVAFASTNGSYTTWVSRKHLYYNTS
ncbi:hypothetical protein L209DRAFT_749368 [Thermothelomyces heterothallicus CBS 203.75]